MTPKISDVPMGLIVSEDHSIRVLAVRIPANDCYAERLMLIALPGSTDERIEVVGALTVYSQFQMRAVLGNPPVDWIESHPDFRRMGIARRLWNTAEAILGHAMEHDPCTVLGRKFAKAMMNCRAKEAKP